MTREEIPRWIGRALYCAAGFAAGALASPLLLLAGAIVCVVVEA